MRKIMAIVVALMIAAGVAQAEQKYNPHSGEWETVPDNSNWQTRYNPHEGDWSYQPQNAQIEYNPFENKWEWDSGHNPGDE